MPVYDRNAAVRIAPGRKAKKSLSPWLFLCPPALLLIMWSDRCSWNRAVKSAVSLVFVCAVLAVTLPALRAPEQGSGGVQVVSLGAAADMMGPDMKAGALPYDVYVPKYIPEKSVLTEPTPEPEPYYVWCNDGGKYYHRKSCAYARSTTPKATIIQAVNAGFRPCKDCKPPKLQDVYGLGY